VVATNRVGRSQLEAQKIVSTMTRHLFVPVLIHCCLLLSYYNSLALLENPASISAAVGDDDDRLDDRGETPLAAQSPQNRAGDDVSDPIQRMKTYEDAAASMYDDDDEEKENDLQVSAEEIKAQIRKEAARLLSLDDVRKDDNYLPHLLSPEDIKVQIRREALLHHTAVAGDIGEDYYREVTETSSSTASTTDHFPNPGPDDRQGDSSTDSSTARTTTIRESSSRSAEHFEEQMEPTEETADIVVDPPKIIESRTLEQDSDEHVVLNDRDTNASERNTMGRPPERPEAPLLQPTPTVVEDVPILSSGTTTIHNSTDDRTMLDIFGERAKEFLTRRVVRYTHTCDTGWSRNGTHISHIFV
jgi:hypothetical protein